MKILKSEGPKYRAPTSTLFEGSARTALTANVTPSIDIKVRRLAQEQHRTISSIICDALDFYFEERDHGGKDSVKRRGKEFAV